MKALVAEYADRMQAAGLAPAPLVAGLDDAVAWNRNGEETATLEAVMAGMQISALICAEPAEPYRTILGYLAARHPDTITPGDCETRTFLHDLPVARHFTPEAILERLRARKSVIVADRDRLQVVTFGTVSPEQAFVTFSSVCFAGFVLFFSDYLSDARAGSTTAAQRAAFARATAALGPLRAEAPALRRGPFTREADVYAALVEAGRHTVDYGLVDSYFGNISYRLGDTIYISQTGSSLDALAGCIDPCPMDGSSCAGITASSELAAHHGIFRRTANRAILHGHPRFSVVLSMDCDAADCTGRGRCHIQCPRDRWIADVPVVPGEVGTGPTGLCRTLPPAIAGQRGAIVWGHGLFTVGADDFNTTFRHLLEIENLCRQTYFERAARALAENG